MTNIISTLLVLLSVCCQPASNHHPVVKNRLLIVFATRFSKTSVHSKKVFTAPILFWKFCNWAYSSNPNLHATGTGFRCFAYFKETGFAKRGPQFHRKPHEGTGLRLVGKFQRLAPGQEPGPPRPAPRARWFEPALGTR